MPSRYLLYTAGLAALVWGFFSVQTALGPSNTSITLVSDDAVSAGGNSVSRAASAAGAIADIRLPQTALPATETLEHNRSDPRLARLEGEVVALREQIQGQSAQLANLLGVADESESESPEMTLEEYELAESLAAEEAANEHAARLENIDASLLDEPVGDEWSDHATAAIEQALNSQEISDAELFNVDCRATLCRVDVNHVNQEALATFQMWFPIKVAETLPQMTMGHSEEGEAGFATVVYLAREGYELPQMDALQ